MHVREVEDGADPAEPRGDEEHVVERADLADASHHLDAERNGASLRLEPRAQLAELLADGLERLLARAAEEEAGMEDDHLRAARGRDPGRVVEHPDRHVELLAALRVSHEAGERRVHGEDDPARAASSPSRAAKS